MYMWHMSLIQYHHHALAAVLLVFEDMHKEDQIRNSCS